MFEVLDPEEACRPIASDTADELSGRVDGHRRRSVHPMNSSIPGSMTIVKVSLSSGTRYNPDRLDGGGMNRRRYLTAIGGAFVAVTGGAVVASASRADILADRELTRGRGDAVAIERTIARDSVEYLESTGEVEDNGHIRPFNQWAQRECEELGAETVVSVLESRLDLPVEGVGSGVRYLVFGPVVSVDHTITRDRDGSIVSEPNVALEQLISVAPRTMTVTVAIAGNRYSTDVPVGVGHGEVSMD